MHMQMEWLNMDNTNSHKDHDLFSFGNGVENQTGNPNQSTSKSRVKRSSPPGGIGVPWNSNSASKYVEMVVVIDNRKFNDLKGDVKGIVQRTKDIINVVNRMYQTFNIYIALTGLVIWNQKDEIQISSKGDDTLSSFLYYRRERLLKEHPNDNAQLLTGMEFEDGVVGKAMQGPICSYKYSGGVNSDHNSAIGVIATTLAHELGHNFGLSHDTESCSCDGPDAKCIMSPSSGSNRTAGWSSCSVESMKYALDHGMDYCLRNLPKSLYDSPTCGNGFLEEGEECDCGTKDPEECSNQCCHAPTCKLVSWASCGHGECCDYDTCHYKSGGSVCRDVGPNSACDLPEYCSGLSAFCPADVWKQNGMDCETESGKAYCYNGKCTTHTDQCQLLWGSSGKNSDDICYQKNVNGSQHGHCGYNLVTQEYSKCPRENVKCGILQCEHHHEKLEFGYERVAILPSFFVTIAGKIHPCRSVVTDFGLEVMDPGLVPNGAACGTDKMCVDQKCVPVPTILSPYACPDNCNGNGVCNSRGHCHCKEGYGGPSCDAGGYGGSEDSGPIVDPLGKSSIFSRALYVTFLGFIPLIGVISFYLYHANDNIKKICKRGFGRAVAGTGVAGSPSSGGKAAGNQGKPSQNGAPRGRTSNGVSPTPSAPPGSLPGANTTPDDFFGNYKGFSLSPIKSLPNGSAPVAAAGATGPMKEEERLVKNEAKASRIASAAAAAKRNFLTNGNGTTTSLQRGVSWKDPVASSTIISPAITMEPIDTVDGNVIPSQFPESSDCISNSNSEESIHVSLCNGNSSPNTTGDKVRKQFSFRSATGSGAAAASAFVSRFAAAAISPFRQKPGAGTTQEENGSKRNSISSLGRQRSFNRENLEISQPILQHQQQESAGTENRYENLPVSNPKKSPRLSLTQGANSKPVLKSVDRIKNQAPSIPGAGNTTPSQIQSLPKKKPAVQRAHSMIAPSTTNRNSGTHGHQSVNPNYNSLRRPAHRPTVPPPAPPPSAMAPPAVPPPNLISSHQIKTAPIARLDDSDIGSLSSSTMSPGSPKPLPGNSQTPPKIEPIYDTIADDESPSPTTLLTEKVETLSTGSSENGGGLLSDIICEIQSRNRESIYNSVDRRKLKRNKQEKLSESKSTSNNLAPAPPPAIQNTTVTSSSQSSPRITVNPSFGLLVKPSSPKLKNSVGPKIPAPPIILPKPTNLSGTSAPALVPITAKPTCLVKPNGIPKVDAPPAPVVLVPPPKVIPQVPNNSDTSYINITKINHLNDKNRSSSISSPAGPAVIPLNSLSQALKSAAADAAKEFEPEVIYAPGQLSTIRRGSRPSSFINSLKRNGSVTSDGTVYGKPVPVPMPPHVPLPPKPNSPVPDKTRTTNSSRCNTSRESSSSPTPMIQRPPSPTGYKPFNPYLNRPLTFSTFRPTTGGGSGKKSASPIPPSNGIPPSGTLINNEAS